MKLRKEQDVSSSGIQEVVNMLEQGSSKDTDSHKPVYSNMLCMKESQGNKKKQTYKCSLQLEVLIKPGRAAHFDQTHQGNDTDLSLLMVLIAVTNITR